MAETLLQQAGVRYEKLAAEEHADLVQQYAIMQAPTLIVSTADGVQKYVSVPEIRRYVTQNM